MGSHAVFGAALDHCKEIPRSLGCYFGGESSTTPGVEYTNLDYVDFLNAVAADDLNNLYDANRGNVEAAGGIQQSGSAGSFTYTAIAGRETKPVNFVSFYDTLRFANWLHNGSPIGAQGPATTEDGAYTITEQGISSNSIQRNSEAAYFLTSEDEWYKAAYYDAAATSYFGYPAGSNDPVECFPPTASPNSANCEFQALDVTDVGSYSNSASPYGTFDQGGNVWEWNEAIVAANRGQRGGGYIFNAANAAAVNSTSVNPAAVGGNVGFRIARIVPEPSALGSMAACIAVLGALGRRRRRAGSIPTAGRRASGACWPASDAPP